MIQIACLLKHFLHTNLCVPILINEAVSKQHEPTLSLRSIPQTSSVVPPAPWEQVIKFGELLSWNGSYLPGNWKWVSVMRKDCCEILLGWERQKERRWQRVRQVYEVCVVCLQPDCQRERCWHGQCQWKLAVPQDSSAVMAIGVCLPPGDRCSVISHTHTQPKHTHALTHTHTILRDSILPPRY